MTTRRPGLRAPRGRTYAMLLLAACCLTGCAAGPVTHTVHLKGEPSLNPNSSQKPTPVNIRVYQLTDSAAFEAADFDSLWEDANGVLGDTLIDVTEHVVTITHDEVEVVVLTDEQTRFVGLVGLFNQQDGPWQQCVAVDDVEDWLFSFLEFRIDKTER